MAHRTELLNVSDEMKLDDVRQELCGSECGEELCSSSLDTTEDEMDVEFESITLIYKQVCLQMGFAKNLDIWYISKKHIKVG